MNSRNIAATLTAIITCICTYAQSHSDLHDRQVGILAGHVRTLHDNPDAYVSVREAMAKDLKWTMMSEFADSCSTPEAFCGLRDRVKRTGLNDIALQAEHQRGTVAKSTDLFCNGNDPRYNYSLFEAKIKAGTCMKSRLSHRKGKQYFLVIPFDGPEGLTIEIRYRDEQVRPSALQDGSLAYVIDSPVMENEVIEISVYNSSSYNRSFVIINNNSHRQ